MAGSKLLMEVDFGTFKFERVRVFVSRIHEDQSYVDPQTGIEVYYDDVPAGVDRLNEASWS